jgi:hypothetical protein
MKTRHIASLFGVLAVVGAASSASASSVEGNVTQGPSNYYEHGVDCKPLYGQASQAGYGEPGIGNFSSAASMSVFCSPEVTIPAGASGTLVTNLGVQTIDYSATSPFSCYPFASSSTAGTYWGPNKFTCGTSGGCPDATMSSFTGPASLLWISPFAGVGKPIEFGAYSVGVACTIPPSANYASWVQQAWLGGQST